MSFTFDLDLHFYNISSFYHFLLALLVFYILPLNRLFHYCPVSSQLKKFQHSSPRIFQNHQLDYITALLKTLQRVSISFRIKVFTMAFKTLCYLVPIALLTFFLLVSSLLLISSHAGLLAVGIFTYLILVLVMLFPSYSHLTELLTLLRILHSSHVSVSPTLIITFHTETWSSFLSTHKTSCQIFKPLPFLFCYSIYNHLVCHSNYLLYLLSIICLLPPQLKTPWGRDFYLFCSLMYSHVPRTVPGTIQNILLHE